MNTEDTQKGSSRSDCSDDRIFLVSGLLKALLHSSPLGFLWLRCLYRVDNRVLQFFVQNLIEDESTDEFFLASFIE